MRQRDFDRINYENLAPEVIGDDEISIVIYDKNEIFSNNNLHPVIDQLVAYDLFRPGKVLVQNPFQPDNYREQSAALEDFSLRKHELFTELCQYLGAKKIEIQQISIDDAEDQMKVGAEVDSQVKGVGVTGGSELGLKLRNSLSERLDFNTQFAGSEPQIEEANKFLVEYGLRADESFTNLVRLRQNTANPLKERYIRLNVSEEARRNIDVASRIDIGKIFNGHATVERQQESRKGIDLTVRVVF